MRSNACFWILTEPNEEPSLLVLAALNNGFGACRRIQRLSRRLVKYIFENAQNVARFASTFLFLLNILYFKMEKE